MKKIITTSLFAFSVLVFGLQASAFTYPGGAPTGGGANIAPLNVGPFAQIKQGILGAPFFGSHKIDIQPCQSGSTLVGGGTSCGDIGAISPYNLFRAGNSRFFLSTDDSGRTSALALLSPVNPFEIFRAGKLGNNIFTGLIVDTNGLMSYNTPSNPPAVGDVLTAINAGGAMEWQTPSGGTNLGTGNAGDVLTWDANAGTFVWAQPANSMPAGSTNETLRHDGANWVANNFLYNDGASVNIGNQTPIPGVALNVTGLTAVTGDLAVTNGAHFAMQSGNVGVGVNGNSTPSFATAKLDVDGTLKFRSPGTAPVGTAMAPGLVLATSDNTGTAKWTDINSLITQSPSGVSLPVGSIHQTFRHDGTNWVANSLLQSSPTQVRIGGTAPSSNSPFSFTVDGTSRLVGNTVFDGGTVVFNGPVRIPASAGATKVLTSDALGYATWQPALPVGGANGDILVWNGTTWVTQQPVTLPSGNINQTLRHNGTTWVADNLLKNTGGLVEVVTNAQTDGTTFRAGKTVSGNFRGIAFDDVGVTTGRLTLNPGELKITSGSPGAGKVLTSNASGVATWQVPEGIPDGTVGNTTLRWSGTEWVENFAIVSTGVNNQLGLLGGNTVIGNNISTSPVPLEVKGQIKITGGSIGQSGEPEYGKVLMSNADGVGSWEHPGATMWSNMKIVRNKVTANTPSTFAYCGANYVAISGGVDCEIRDTNRVSISQPVYSPNGSTINQFPLGSNMVGGNIGSPNAWYGKCSGSNTTADVDITVTATCIPR